MEQEKQGKKKRIIRLSGIYKDFNKLQKQLEGRALLVVTIINSNCEECGTKLQKFIHQLEQGFIKKVPRLVMVYGYNTTSISAGNERTETAGIQQELENDKSEEDPKKEKKLGDSRILEWDEIPSGHGYGIIFGSANRQLFSDDFNHDEYMPNILDNLRRFDSPLRTLAGLSAKKQFFENKRTGVIVETNNITQNSKIIELENLLKSYGDQLSVPFNFCKGINQEIVLVDKGEIKHKTKGLKIEKFMKKTKLIKLR